MSFHSIVWTPLLTKLLVASGGMACMLGVAFYRRRLKQALLASSEVKVKEWECEKVSLQKDKERLEQKLFELENILEKMSKEIETLKVSLKDKQKAANVQEAEKERLQEQERRARQESEATIEQLQRRAQQFLRELEVKSAQCDDQSHHIHQLELNNKLFQDKANHQDKANIIAISGGGGGGLAVYQTGEETERDKIYLQHQGLLQQHQVLLQQHQALSLQHDELISQVQGLKVQVHQDVCYLLNFAFNQQNLQQHRLPKPSEFPTLSPLIVGLESTQDPTLVAICKRYGVAQHEGNGVADNHDYGWGGMANGHGTYPDNGPLSFSVSVDRSKPGNLLY
eukprot:Phypoly_transcript_10749.p1 GENE.Phypoly_transcript_10749~~Phypoly_transcript_10749.p1  ORF type:complete len:369 (+),score=73.35 Phypoly_transcript_10749:92-1108(+)